MARVPPTPAIGGRSGPLARAALLLLGAGPLVFACADPAPTLLLLISVDTLRADHLGSYGGPSDRTPRLDALAAQSLRFEAAYASAPFTLPSLAALHTGLPPQQLGIHANESVLPGDVATLAGELHGHGFHTAAVVSNFVLRAASGLASGFAVYDDAFPEREAVRAVPERMATATTDAALAQLGTCLRAPRCFLWVHYQDPHGPYTPPPELRARELERAAPDGGRELEVDADHRGLARLPLYQYLAPRRDVAFYRAGYAGEVRFADGEIGRLLAALEASGRGGEAVVVFAADHGESLGEQEQWFAHGEHLHDAQVRVPLLLRAPGVAPGVRADVVGLVDLRPTLLKLLIGARASGPGRDLLGPAAEREGSVVLLSTLGAATAHRYGIVDGDFKLVVSLRDGAWDARLVRRGREDTDLVAAAPQVVAVLRQRLSALVARVPRRAETRQDLFETERAALRALGYAESP
jgi:arylsulfatase